MEGVRSLDVVIAMLVIAVIVITMVSINIVVAAM
jgi:hypothetical protein